MSSKERYKQQAAEWIAARQTELVQLLQALIQARATTRPGIPGHFIVRKGLVLEIVGEGRHFTVFPKARFVYFQQVLL